MIAKPDTRLGANVHPSPNIEPRRGGVRPDIVLLHYTGMASCAKAIAWLADTRSAVSCHYVIDVDGAITQMVAEDMRAWHAGAGSWGGDADVNSRSIGIEIHNPGHDQGYPEFPAAQMRAVSRLCRDIIARWSIDKRRVLGHSDTAPQRKNDPGEKFDWKGLAADGVGHWVEPAPITPPTGAATPDKIARAQRLLADYGYGIAATGLIDPATTAVLRAFQRHFRPALVDGQLDASTLDTIERLIATP